MDVYRIAVWNMAKIPLVFTMGVWVADVGFLINSKYILHQDLQRSLSTLVTPQVQYG
jgi:hypothetical protein